MAEEPKTEESAPVDESLSEMECMLRLRGLAKGAIPKDLMVTSKASLNELCKPSK